MRNLLLALALASAPRAHSAPAAAPADPVFRALGDEMARSMAKLEMPGLGKPYFLSYTVDDSTSLYISGVFGALRVSSLSPMRYLKVQLRVGAPGFDSSNYVSKDFWSYRPLYDRLAADEGYDALRFGAWSLTDEAYKQAVQRLSQKKAYEQARLMADDLPDLSREPAQSSVEPVQEAPPERGAWEGRIRALSGVFREFPRLQHSEANLSAVVSRTHFLDSEGRRVLKPSDGYQLTLAASAQADDGMELGDRRRFVWRRPQDIPPQAALEAEARALGDDLSKMTRAPKLGSYIGPVLFEGQAAGEFFNQLLARNLSAARAPLVEEDAQKERFSPGDLTGRLGLRVLTPSLSVIDDPLLADWAGVPLAGHYRVDDEGIPARRISLIEKGVLKDVPMSRAPVKDRPRSNGHGRSDFGEFPSGRPGVLIIRPEAGLGAAELKAELLRQAREFGLSYGLVVRRLCEEDRQEENERLCAPTLLYKVHVADGREELVRGARFTGVTLRALRDIRAVSKDLHVHNFLQFGPYRHNRGELHASIVHPSVLVAEMELKDTEKKPEKPPYLKHPQFDR